MPRVISVFLPTLSTDRVRRKAGDTAPPPETPLILVGRDGRRRVVLAADAAAHAAGLRVGMPASKAQALVQSLVIQDADPTADAEALERLALWMQRFAPIVAADPPDGIVIDSAGADHLHGGEAATLAILAEKLVSVGLRARAAIADTWGAAHALARFDARPGLVSEPGNAARDVAPLPIAALRLASDMVRDLHVLGFDRVGDLLGQPRAPLTLRTGARRMSKRREKCCRSP
jgi:protein ImuB